MPQAAQSKSVIKPTKRSFKREAILDVGARIMNDRGAGAIRLGDIGTQLGLSRNALYYYVRDRTDLVRQCYLRACDTLEEDFDLAVKTSHNPKDQIANFISRTLSINRPQRAVVADTDVLEEPYRSDVRMRHNQIVVRLQEVLLRGQVSGGFRSFDTQIASNVLLGILNWTLLWVNWSANTKPQATTNLQASSKAIQHLFFDGLTESITPGFVCKFDYDSLTQKQFNVFDRSDANQLRQLRLVEAASLLFNKRGLDGTSIDDIAESVGASKGAVYYHYKDKSALINDCYSRAFEHYETIANAAEELCEDSLEFILSVFHLNCQAQASTSPPLILQPGLMKLPQNYIDRTYDINQNMLKHLNVAKQSGMVQFHSPEIVGATAGAFFWIQKWRDKRPELPSKEIADKMTEIVKVGICMSPKI